MRPKQRPPAKKDPFGLFKVYAVLIGAVGLWVIYKSVFTITPPAIVTPPPQPARLLRHAEPSPSTDTAVLTFVPKAARPDPWTSTGGVVASTMSGPLEDRMGLHFDLCGALEKTGRYWAPLMRGLVENGTGVIIVPARFGSCLAAGKTVKFAFANFDPVSFLPYGYLGELPVTITSVRPYERLADMAADRTVLEQNPGLKLEKAYENAEKVYGPYNMRGTLDLIILSARPAEWRIAGAGIPLASPYAATVEKAEVGALKGSGATLLDLRVETFYLAETIPGAKSLYVDRTQMSVVPKSPTKLQQIPMPTAEIDLIPKDQTVVLFADGPESYSPYNFATYLALRGYRDVRYFPGGMQAWRGEELATPAILPGVSVVDATAARDLLKDKRTVVVDLRDVDLVAKKILPAKLVIADYVEKLDEKGKSVSRVQNVTPALIKASGDDLKIVGQALKTATGPVLVFGMDEFDWKACKTAVLLHERGKNVSWLRKGYRDWDIEHKLEPTTFRYRKARAGHKKMAAKVKARHRVTPEQMLERLPLHKQRSMKKGGPVHGQGGALPPPGK